MDKCPECGEGLARDGQLPGWAERLRFWMWRQAHRLNCGHDENRLTIKRGGRVLFDEVVPDDGLRYRVTRPSPLNWGDPVGPTTVELQASNEALSHLQGWWKL